MESGRMSNSANPESDRMESGRMSNSSNPESDRMDSDRNESDRICLWPLAMALLYSQRQKYLRDLEKIAQLVRRFNVCFLSTLRTWAVKFLLI
jgi:hypothetical protein